MDPVRWVNPNENLGFAGPIVIQMFISRFIQNFIQIFIQLFRRCVDVCAYVHSNAFAHSEFPPGRALKEQGKGGREGGAEVDLETSKIVLETCQIRFGNRQDHIGNQQNQVGNMQIHVGNRKIVLETGFWTQTVLETLLERKSPPTAGSWSRLGAVLGPS